MGERVWGSTRGTGLAAPGLNKLARALRKQGVDLRKEAKKVHRKYAGVIAKDIKQRMPKTGTTVGGSSLLPGAKSPRGRVARAKRKEGPRHDTPRGAMARTVRTAISTEASAVLGGKPGNKRSRHYLVNELGGAVWWHRRGAGWARTAQRRHHSYGTKIAEHRLVHGRANAGHIIPVRPRSPMSGRYPSGWFFYPTAFARVPAIITEYDRELEKVVRRSLHAAGGHFYSYTGNWPRGM